jgi:acetyl esterase/lipase
MIPRLIALAVVVTIPLVIFNFRGVAYGLINAPTYFGSYERRADLPYGALPRQSLDVYVPRGGANRPVVVFWHGGAWVFGGKEEARFVGAALADAGYVAIVPNYRKIPHFRFPHFIDDSALAVKWAREHARELGGDPDALFVMGHSAGGYLAAMLALDEQYLAKVGGDASWIRGWIGLSVPYEMRNSLSEARVFLGVKGGAKWRPIDLVSERAPPALLVHGLEDRAIHPQEAVNIQTKLRDAGVPAECRIYEDVEHAGTVLNMSLPVGSETLAHVQDFIEAVLAGVPERGAAERSAPCPSLEGRKTTLGGPRPKIPTRTPRREQAAVNG